MFSNTGNPDWVGEPISPIIAIPGSIILLTAFIIFFRSTLQYLKTVHDMIEILERDYPDMWEELGNPKWIFVGNTRYLQPIMPFIKWIWAGDPTGFKPADGQLFHRTSTLLRRSLKTFFVFAVVLLAMVGLSLLKSM